MVVETNRQGMVAILLNYLTTATKNQKFLVYKNENHGIAQCTNLDEDDRSQLLCSNYQLNTNSTLLAELLCLAKKKLSGIFSEIFDIKKVNQARSLKKLPSKRNQLRRLSESLSTKSSCHFPLVPFSEVLEEVLKTAILY